MALPLSDESLMPWGKHLGKRMADVPTAYLKWFAHERWRDVYPETLAYALTRIGLSEPPAVHDRRAHGPAQPPTPWITGSDYVQSTATDAPF